MKKIIILALLAIAGSQVYEKYTTPVISNADLESLSEPSTTTTDYENAFESNYSCDGRQHCSQMSSCEEATFFINNCPNTKMDGNHDGVPCERQWCN